LGAIGARCRLAFLGRHFINTLGLTSAGAERAEDVRHAPDSILVSHEDVVLPPRESVRPVQIFDVTVDPPSVPGAVVPQQSEISGALFSNQNIAIGQNEQLSRI